MQSNTSRVEICGCAGCHGPTCDMDGYHPTEHKGERLTIAAARMLAARAPSCATYYRAFEAGKMIERWHKSAGYRCYDLDGVIGHLEAGRRVEVREAAAEGVPVYILEGIADGVRASI